MGQLVKNNTLTALAQALTAPRDINPLRFPSLTPARTDVARNTMVFSIYTPSTTEAATFNPISGANPQGGEVYLYLTKHPLLPLFYPAGPFTVTLRYGATGYDRGASISGQLPSSSSRWVIPLNAAKANQVSYTEYGEELGLGVIVGRGVSAISGTMPTAISENPAYMFHSRMLNSEFMFFGGGSFNIGFTTTQATSTSTNLPAGSSLQIWFCLQMYTGSQGNLIDLTTVSNAEDSVTIAGGASTVSFSYSTVYDVASAGSVKLGVGFYRIRVLKSCFTAGAADTGNFSLQILLDNIINNQWVYLPKVNNVYKDAAYVYENARTNCHAMLVTNRTPNLIKGGAAYGAKMEGPDNLFTLPLTAIDAASAVARTGYSGEAAKGIYTWMEREPGDDDFRPLTAGKGLSLVPLVELDEIKTFHWVKLATDPSTGVSTFIVNIASHVEFKSEHQLAKLAPAACSISDLIFANRTLVNAPLFTENWIHLKQLWNGIQRVGKSMLVAGGTAAAKIALQEIMAASAFL